MLLPSYKALKLFKKVSEEVCCSENLHVISWILYQEPCPAWHEALLQQ